MTDQSSLQTNSTDIMAKAILNTHLVIPATGGKRELLRIDLRTGEVTADLNSIDEAADRFIEALHIKLNRCSCGNEKRISALCGTMNNCELCKGHYPDTGFTCGHECHEVNND